MIPTAIKKVRPCCICGTDEGPLNTGNVMPGRLRAERFGRGSDEWVCVNCYNNLRYRHVIRPRRLAARSENRVYQESNE